jgi:glycosyltransferase involved in cell wall biosynthesis
LRFSLIYPTRHRQKFIGVALNFLLKQKYDDFEVIVSDNYSDPSLSCEDVCKKSPLKNIKYIRPPEPIGMVDNWNYALGHATGDYIFFFTDKMFLLPETLSNAGAALVRKPG